MYTLIIISLIFFGLVFGSFGSVIFYRLWDWPTKETWKWFLVWRSECPKCHHQLKVRNLVPIFSWIFQWWKCEYCKAPISRFYPFLEITSVIIFVWVFLIYSKLGWLSNYFIWDLYMWLKEWYIFTAVTIIYIWLTRLILLYDIKTYELHITATVFLAIITLIFTLTFWTNRLEILLWIWIFTLIFGLIYYGSKLYVKQKYKKDAEWFWLWDVIIAPILWAWLVFFLQPNWIFEWMYLVCLFIILSSLVGLLYYLIENLVKYFIMKKKKKSKKPYGFQASIPFLPSMIIWFILEVIFREPIIQHLLFNV
jgi:prepilin signal peptidase PulO-like enzyme (type II secretory pathway)